MNNLSWFLYWAEVIPNISGMIVVIVSGVIILWGFSGLFSVTTHGEAEYPFHGWHKDGVTRLHVPIIATIMLVVTSLMPSKETIYLIAGSEAGEAVVSSPEAREILSDIQTIIKQQIKPAVK